MSEEKKLDEKALEEVTGGSIGLIKFKTTNCVYCGHYFNHTCPYGSSADAIANAIDEFGKSAQCPEKVAL